MNRTFTRDIKNKFKFYKSINLLADDNLYEKLSFKEECELRFHLFQFRIHYNLRRDYENELFYEQCGEFYLIKKDNNYNHNYMKCFDQYLFPADETETEQPTETSRLLKIVSDYWFYLTLVVILSLLGPVLCMTCNHLYLDIYDYKFACKVNSELIKTSKESISINKSELIEDKTKTLVEKVFSDQENGINSQEEFNKDSVTPENFET